MCRASSTAFQLRDTVCSRHWFWQFQYGQLNYHGEQGVWGSEKGVAAGGLHYRMFFILYFFLVHSICSGDWCRGWGPVLGPCCRRDWSGSIEGGKVTPPWWQSRLLTPALVNGLKSLGKSTLTRELTGTTDLQSKFQRLVPQGERLPVATKGPYFPMLGLGFSAFFFIFINLLVGQCTCSQENFGRKHAEPDVSMTWEKQL